jgi:microcystin-dependent protein
MARKYAGRQGKKFPSTSLSAPGAWLAPTEAAREKSAGAWPSAVPAGSAASPVGSLSFAMTSGVTDTALESLRFLVCDGEEYNRVDQGGLFSVIGTSFGEGDGSTTFAVPNMFDGYIYAKGSSSSGVYALGSGKVGEGHLHNWQGVRSRQGPDRNRTGSEQASAAGPSVVVHASTTFGDIQNEMKKREFVPMVNVGGGTMQAGMAIPFLWPGEEGDLIGFATNKFVVASGQNLSRSEYADLFSLFGTHFGTGDGSTTFGVPDLRGLFVSGSRQQYSDGFQPSGVIGGSGFLPDHFTAHYHLFEGGNWNSQQGGAGNQSRTNQASTPQSGVSQGPANGENRADNISVIWAIVASNS